tara:strand:+ start:830 stop:1036 length:207 start_codon:yes stop_codon:yes gene_type:complete
VSSSLRSSREVAAEVAACSEVSKKEGGNSIYIASRVATQQQRESGKKTAAAGTLASLYYTSLIFNLDY